MSFWVEPVLTDNFTLLPGLLLDRGGLYRSEEEEREKYLFYMRVVVD